MAHWLDHLSLYRLPWSLTDNPIAWLEPTQACNLACDGCYRKNVREHKPMDEVEMKAQERPPTLATISTYSERRSFIWSSVRSRHPGRP